MLTIDHLNLIKENFSGEDDSKLILNDKLFEGWQLPISQISYISDIIEVFDGNLDQALARLESDNYMQELTPFMPGFKKSPQKKKEKTISRKSAKPQKKITKQSPGASQELQKEQTLMPIDSYSYLDRIQDYKLVSAHTVSALNQEVKKEMELYGWIPFGGASVSHAGMGSSIGGSGSYFQAMVKLKKK